ncbi:MAG: dihydrolipoyllysine-residue succinyltransferase [Mariprofundaceae bacterium]|nr:dihydrolipoyllysine-residue succinyltransferase [Mariprofundaceae bacterium]
MSDVEIKVPSLGESESEATLVSWLKHEGDTVAVDDVLAEIESDKITMEITALDAGVVKKIFRQADEVVEPGEVIALIDTAAKGTAADTAAAKAGRRPEVRAGEKPADEAETVQQKAEAAVEELPQQPEPAPMPEVIERSGLSERAEERVAMSGLRKRIATRLKDAQNTAAMLTTFNEVNMQQVIDLRVRYKDRFKEKYGVNLGFMSFFVKACAHAASRFPAVNAYIDGQEIVYHNYMDIGVAVSTDRGLVVPVLRDVGQLSFSGIEKGIVALAVKARDGGLVPDDLKGGTFSITNGGVFGSLLSTPILNPPQSAILGMHSIQKRPVAEDGHVVIRPMMYLALTYDHRLIDGREAVQFLVAVKEYLEQPGMALLEL